MVEESRTYDAAANAIKNREEVKYTFIHPYSLVLVFTSLPAGVIVLGVSLFFALAIDQDTNAKVAFYFP